MDEEDAVGKKSKLDAEVSGEDCRGLSCQFSWKFPPPLGVNIFLDADLDGEAGPTELDAQLDKLAIETSFQ